MKFTQVAAAVLVSFVQCLRAESAPGDVAAGASPTREFDTADTLLPPVLQPSSSGPTDRIDFELPVEDETYRLSVSVSSPSANKAYCGNSNVVFNTPSGPVLVAANQPEDSETELLVEDITGRIHHALRVQIDSSCIWSPQQQNPDVPSKAVELISAEVAVVHRASSEVEAFEPRAKHVTGFTIHWDSINRYIIAVVAQPSLRTGQDFSSLGFPKTFYSPAVLPPHHESHQDPRVDDEERLEQLHWGLQKDEEDLQILVDRIARARKAISKLVQPNSVGTEEATLESCKTLHCILSTIYSKGKDCIHRIYLSVSSLVSPGNSADSCSDMASLSPHGRAKVLMNPSHKCFEYSEKTNVNHKVYELSSESHEKLATSDSSDSEDDEDGSLGVSASSTTSHESPFNFGDASSRVSSATRTKIYAILGVVTSLLCFGCLGLFLHSRCCNPRAKADRAALREEYRNRRDFRRAAQRHAFKDWWTRYGIRFGACMGCGGKKERITDYEEKRALILQQEQVLEDVMQGEIRHIRRSHRLQGDSVSALEEGRAGAVVPMHRHLRVSPMRPLTEQRISTSSDSDSDGASSTDATLPSYRSRASTGPLGRPPSYHERPLPPQALCPGRATYDPTPYVVDGFRDYRPAVVTISEFGGSEGLASNVTPDSSVVALSPRGSSETLRTERSAL